MSNVIQFVPATREQVFSRTCLTGPGGSGKTYTALMLMHELTNGGKYAVVDTERGRSKKYVGVNGWQFGILEPHSFNPETLIDILAAAADQGFEAITVDSGSLYWNGAEGMTEQVDKRTKAAGRRDSFSSGWSEMAPIERRMWDAVMTFPGHVVMTLRVKSDYVVEEVQRGNRTVATPRKVGLKPVQRDGFEYEFDLVIALDQENTATVVKTDLVVIPNGTVVEKPGPEFARLIGDFCSEGVAVEGPLQYREQSFAADATVESLKGLFDKVNAAGFANTPVLDDMNVTIALGDLIRKRAAAIKAVEDQAARDAKRAEQPAPLAAAPDADKPASHQAPTGAGRAARQSKADVAVAAGKGFDAMIAAPNAVEARRVADYATGCAAAAVDVSGFLTNAADSAAVARLEQVRENLGIIEGEPVTLADFGALVASYWETHGRPVDSLPDAPAATEAPAVAEDAAA